MTQMQLAKHLKSVIAGLRASRAGYVQGSLLVAEALHRLDHLRELWQENLPSSEPAIEEDLPWTSEECYDFLAAYGIVWRSQLGATLDSDLLPLRPSPASEQRPAVFKATPPSLLTSSWVYDLGGIEARGETTWAQLAHEFGEVLTWTGEVLRAHGARIAAYAVHIPDPISWITEAERLYEASELGHADLTDTDISEITSDVTEALRQLDEAELVCALCRIVQERMPAATGQNVNTISILTDFPAALDELETALDQSLAWLEEHPEGFLLASAYVQMVVAGLRDDLRDFPDLERTVWKFLTLVDCLRVSEGRVGLTEPNEFKAAIRESVLGAKMKPVPEPAIVEIPTVRLSAGDTTRLPTAGAYPREVLGTLLAAASGTPGAPKVLRWQSPDGRYRANLVPSGTQVWLHIFSASGERASELANQPVRVAGVSAMLDATGSAQFDIHKLLEKGEAVYLEVGEDRSRWRPIQEPGQLVPASNP
ncbi:MAG: hypothetical protein RMI91_00145 [Gemmatales bacterium]|nr:hypothetical protein [Gemmatales bacterium]MDW7993043.1 hypothetical protein [Gemmatales bacterium]